VAEDTDAEGFETDQHGAPIFENTAAKIRTLRRRMELLKTQLEGWRPGYRGEDFARAEVAALRAGIAALKYHRAEVQGLDTVVTVLEQLVEAVGEEAAWASAPELERARKVLAEWRS
jgi:hypothetical protein